MVWPRGSPVPGLVSIVKTICWYNFHAAVIRWYKMYPLHSDTILLCIAGLTSPKAKPPPKAKSPRAATLRKSPATTPGRSPRSTRSSGILDDDDDDDEIEEEGVSGSKT